MMFLMDYIYIYIFFFFFFFFLIKRAGNTKRLLTIRVNIKEDDQESGFQKMLKHNPKSR